MLFHGFAVPRSPADGAGGAAVAAPAAAAPAPAATAAPPAFADTLPEEFRGDPSLKDIKDLHGLTKGYVHAQRLVGAPPDQIVRLPTTDDPAAWDTVWTRLGRPETPDKYDLPTPAGIKEDPAFKADFAQAAHKAGVPLKQARALFDWYNGKAAEVAQAQAQASTAALAQAEAALKAQWGAAFDDNLTAARGALAHYFGQKLTEKLATSGFGNDPEFLNGFAKLGRALREDGIIGRGDQPGAFSPAEATQQISALRADPKFVKAYTDKRDPGHADAVAKMERLYQQAHPPT